MRDKKDQSPQLTRILTANFHVVRLALPSHDEYFITAYPEEGESIEALGTKVAELAEDYGAVIVAQDLFGAGDGESMGDRSLLPMTRVGNRSGRSDLYQGVQAWAVGGTPVEALRLEGKVLGYRWSDPHASWCRMGGLAAGNLDLSRPDQSTAVFEIMEKALQAEGMEFKDTLRTWFYLNNILAWYKDFNLARDAFFTSREIFGNRVPASTGMGNTDSTGQAVVGGLLAVQPRSDEVKAFAVPSPLQCQALDYGSAFSRALELDLPDHRRLYVSGTASISPEGEFLHPEDVDRQVELTMAVVKAILDSRDMDWVDVTRAVAYFKHKDGQPAYDRYAKRVGLPDLPVVFVNNDVCWKELLFEIEVDAVQVKKRDRHPLKKGGTVT